ncbi:hypothetical protein [Mesorhizobium sp. M0488]|uniref:hypothetical protein n=1 Tax=unclassified Mesorhizobium TaxID=325217 RepID=UPI003336477C
MPRKYQTPNFLGETLAPAKYERWLQRKAVAHRTRDRKRGNKEATIAGYKTAIHKAVIFSEGRDIYTGEQLDWALISTYDNERSKGERRAYKASLALLPTVDHLNDGLGPADFAICAWRTNDAKNDLDADQFVALCRRVVAHADGLNDVSA